MKKRQEVAIGEKGQGLATVGQSRDPAQPRRVVEQLRPMFERVIGDHQTGFALASESRAA